MARIAGVNTQKDTKGNITHVTINTKKHPEAAGKLKELGLMEKTQFEKDYEKAMPFDQFEEKLSYSGLARNRTWIWSFGNSYTIHCTTRPKKVVRGAKLQVSNGFTKPIHFFPYSPIDLLTH